MSLIHMHYWSAPLQLQMTMHIVIPQTPGPHPVIYQLHGQSDDCSIWQRRTTIELHAERIGAMVVMLEGGRSFYTNKADGTGNWEAHILESVAVVDASFRTRANRRGRAIGGLSMGGYGALRLGLRHGALFGSVVSHSGAADIRHYHRESSKMANLAQETLSIFGARIRPQDDLFALATRAKPLPLLSIDCGTEDFLLPGNRLFHAHLTRRGIAHRYVEHPGGHTWSYWEARLTDAFDAHQRWFSGSRRR